MRHRNPRGEMPFLDHLEELRWRIFKAAGGVVAGTAISFLLVLRFDGIGIIMQPLCAVIARLTPEELVLVGEGTSTTMCKLMNLAPTEPFFFVLKLGLLGGLVLASPVVIYQIWAFLAPALESRERKVLIPSLFLGMFLFIAGATLSYYIAIPVTLDFLLLFEIEWFEPRFTAQFYFPFITRMLLVFGIIFELPVVVMILSVLGLVTPRFLRDKRRHAIVLITVVAAFLSPGDFILLTVLMMLPLVLLYELSIGLSVLVYRKKDEEERSILGPPSEDSVEAER